jgi:hypothetical protein
MDWLGEHWAMAAKLIGTGGLIAVLPRLFRGLIAIAAAPVLLEIEREKNHAREEQVADLLTELTALRKQRGEPDQEREAAS